MLPFRLVFLGKTRRWHPYLLVGFQRSRAIFLRALRIGKVCGSGLILLYLFSCAMRRAVEVEPFLPAVEKKIAAADSLSKKGCLVALKRAYRIYEEVYRQPGCGSRVAEKLAKTSLLIAVREKELGIANQEFMDAALAVIRENPSLGELLPWAEIAGLFWVQGKGVMRDIDERFPWPETSVKLKNMEPELHSRALTDEFFAYLYATYKCAFSSPFEEKGGFDWLGEVFPDSLLLRYKAALCPREDERRLKEVLAEEPEFYEASYNLGNLALARRNLLEAENYFLRAHQGIPQSSQITLLLGSIYLAFEELERALEFYEKTLTISPHYRDALLGQALCFGYIGDHLRAIELLEKILELGHWLIGESYYWLAWNRHQLKDNRTAAENIEEAKGRLPTSTEVFTLSGVIALEEGNLAKAEKDLKEALQYGPTNSEALFSLGSLYARQEEWRESGIYFEKAALAFEAEEQALEERIAGAEASSLSAERKEKFIRKKRLQLEKTCLSKATAFYNGAAGYFNAGEKKKALDLARRASEHPSFLKKAEELLSRIKMSSLNISFSPGP